MSIAKCAEWKMAGNVKVLAPTQLREMVFNQAMALAGNNAG